MNSQKKINLYIDGTNLFAGLVELFGAEGIPPFPKIREQITKLFPSHRIYFYASYMGKVNLKNQKLRGLVKTELSFFNQVKAAKEVYFYKGHRSPTSGKEKGVDVHLAVDIVKHVFSRECDEVIIMTGDADLVYPIEIVKKLGALTHAIFLPNRFSLGISLMADTAMVLNYLHRFKFHKDQKKPKKLKIIEIK